MANEIRDATKITQAVLSQDEVRALATECPTHHQAYEFGYDTVERKLSLEETAAMVERVRSRMDALRAARPDNSDVELSLALKRESDAIRLFADNSHPVIFRKIVDRTTPQAVLDNLERMIQTKIAIERGFVDEDMALSALQHHILEQCKGPGEEA